jgi:hypothetical protein
VGFITEQCRTNKSIHINFWIANRPMTASTNKAFLTLKSLS